MEVVLQRSGERADDVEAPVLAQLHVEDLDLQHMAGLGALDGDRAGEDVRAAGEAFGAGMHLGQRFSHALISAPQEQIEAGFVKRDYQEIAFPDCQGVAVPSIQVPKALIKGARESRLGSVKRVIHYLRQPGPLDHAFACTHAALNLLTPEDLPADLSGKALFIDEAHHASADGLSQIVTLWRECGAIEHECAR